MLTFIKVCVILDLRNKETEMNNIYWTLAIKDSDKLPETDFKGRAKYKKDGKFALGKYRHHKFKTELQANKAANSIIGFNYHVCETSGL